jgi:hypothetical protein
MHARVNDAKAWVMGAAPQYTEFVWQLAVPEHQKESFARDPSEREAHSVSVRDTTYFQRRFHRSYILSAGAWLTII